MHIGLDIGTSGTKAALVSEGRIIKAASAKYGMNTRGGYRELDAEEVWNAVMGCLQEIGRIGPVRSITVSSLGEAIIPADKNGKPLYGSITGTDARGIQQYKKLCRGIEPLRLAQITGVNPGALYSLCKISWLKENEPELWKKIEHVFTFQDFIVYRLCGAAAIDHSMASRTMLFDIEEKQWSKEISALADIDYGIMSEPFIAGTIVGRLKDSLAAELGIKGNPVIVLGAHDHISNAVGCGVCKVGWAADAYGTTEGITAVIDKRSLKADSIIRYGISREPFVQAGLYNTVAWNNTSGVLLQWFAQKMCGRQDVGAALDELNEKMPEAPSRQIVLPHFSGAATPYMDELSRGVIFGLTLDTKCEEIYKAVIEGGNYELRNILESMRATGISVDKLVVSGGAARPRLLQIKADILNMEIQAVSSQHTATLGGALIGAVACGDFDGISEAGEYAVKPDKTYYPQEGKTQLYDELFEVYKRLYPSLNREMHRLSFR